MSLLCAMSGEAIFSATLPPAARAAATEACTSVASVKGMTGTPWLASQASAACSDRGRAVAAGDFPAEAVAEAAAALVGGGGGGARGEGEGWAHSEG